MKKEQIAINYFPFTDGTDEKNIRKDILKNPEKFLKGKMIGSKFDFGVMELMTYGAYREAGYYYSFKPLLKLYVYEQYDQWQDVYALNKTNVRHLIGGRIDNIMEVTANNHNY